MVAIAHTSGDYTGALRQLLPPGPALPREDDTWLTGLLSALAEELARVEARGLRLIEELDPRTSLELLPDWERICGLPWCGGTALVTVPERRAAIMARLTAQGGQSIAYLTQLAASLGVVVVIDEFAPLRAAFRAGGRCAGIAWAFAFRVEVLPEGAIPDGGTTTFVRDELDFRAGAGRAGDRLRAFATSSLECVIDHAKPAHATAFFAYPAAAEPAWSFDFTGA